MINNRLKTGSDLSGLDVSPSEFEGNGDLVTGCDRLYIEAVPDSCTIHLKQQELLPLDAHGLLALSDRCFPQQRKRGCRINLEAITWAVMPCPFMYLALLRVMQANQGQLPPTAVLERRRGDVHVRQDQSLPVSP